MIENDWNAVLETFAHGELRLTLIVCAISLVAVWLPLMQGVRLCWRARAATRPPRGNRPSGAVTQLARSVVVAAARDDDSALPFVRDAARQLVTDDYETSYAQPISMYANLLPPIGFIGTTCGLAVLLISMHLSANGLQLGALALALSSTIFALVGYALLEGTKIHLYGRLARSLREGIGDGAGD